MSGCCDNDAKQQQQCPVVVISAGKYAPPCGYSRDLPALPKIQLPAFNAACLKPFQIPKPSVRWINYDEIVVNKAFVQTYSTCKTFVIENIVHHQHKKKVITTVNRNHMHTQRIITRDNNYHHFSTDYVVKVNDIHIQKVEVSSKPGTTTNDYKQTTLVEDATCNITSDQPTVEAVQAQEAFGDETPAATAATSMIEGSADFSTQSPTPAPEQAPASYEEPAPTSTSAPAMPESALASLAIAPVVSSTPSVPESDFYFERPNPSNEEADQDQ